MVKLADRLHKLQTIEIQSFEKKRIAIKMLDFYIPLGEIFKFGSINQVVHEIERFFQAIINETNTT